MRLWKSINNMIDELMSLDMILMDEKVNFSGLYYTAYNIYLCIYFLIEKCDTLFNLEEYN
jgi:hypothetical protein